MRHITRTCMVCNQTYSNPDDDPNVYGPGGEVSHGLCAECEDVAEQDAAEDDS